MIEIYPPKNNIPTVVMLLGHQGENEARCVVFDLAAYAEEFGEGTWAVVYKRPGEDTPYPVAELEESAGYALWKLNNVDTGLAGEGRAEFRYYVDEVLVKSDVYRTLVLPSLGETGPAPDPLEDILDRMIEEREATEEAAESAKNSETAAESSKTTAQEAAASVSGSATAAAASAAAAGDAEAAAEEYAAAAASFSGGTIAITNMVDGTRYKMGFRADAEGLAVTLTEDSTEEGS